MKPADALAMRRRKTQPSAATPTTGIAAAAITRMRGRIDRVGRSFRLTLLGFAAALAVAAARAEDLTLQARERPKIASTDSFAVAEKTLVWKPRETAMVLCDLWDDHWCKEAAARVAEMAPRINETIKAARQRGVLIIHCPSDTMPFYEGTPQRRLAQAAPKVESPVPLQRWCKLDPAKEAPLPIDDSDGGCETEGIAQKIVWTRQHPAIEIAEGDAITDSAEAYYLMRQRGIANVIVLGVHTNMCVLGRPFSIRQMVAQGQRVLLMHDLTDALYNPKRPPFVSHFRGTELMIEHIEKYWCPSITSADFLGGEPFRFKASPETTPLGNDARADFEWFDTLGFPDTKDLRFVRVLSGHSISAGQPPEPQYLHGFLRRRQGDEFSVLSTQLQPLEFTRKTGAGTPAYAQVDFEAVSLGNHAAKLLEAAPQPPGRDARWRRFGERLSERAEIFFVARACHRQGFDALAESLYRRAAAMPLRNSRQEDGRDFRERLERDLGHAMMWRAIVDFGNLRISRRELLAQFQAIIKNYPRSEHQLRAEATAERLEMMVAEDAAHPAITDEEMARLPVEQRVAELIFRLRDQNGHQWSQPGSCDIFADWGPHGERGRSPAHQLVTIGHPAIPQLIAALDDSNFSRSVGYGRDFVFSHNVLRVSDCAKAILERIAGRTFHVPSGAFVEAGASKRAAETRKAIDAWWAELQAKGAQAVLTEATQRGDDLAPSQARMLVEKFPAAAGTAVVAGAQAARKRWPRTELIEIAALLQDPLVTDFLQRELTSGPFLGTRLAAAQGLRARGDPTAVETMIGEWRKTRTQAKQPDDSLSALIGFLVTANSPAAISALGERLRERPPAVRMAVISAFRPAGNFSAGIIGPGPGFVRLDNAPEPSPATNAAIERLLAEALDDLEERLGFSGSIGNTRFTDPRVCDLAAFALANRWKDRYTFDLAAPMKTRERQRIECANVWRKAQGLDPIPFPATTATTLPPEQANVVSSVEIATADPKPSPDLKKAAEVLRGKLLTSDAFVALLDQFAQSPGAAGGLHLRATRDQDLTGVVLHLRFLPKTNRSEPSGWETLQRITLGTRDLYNSSGYSSADHMRRGGAWKETKSAIDEALAGAPTLPFVLRVALHLKAPEEDDAE